MVQAVLFDLDGTITESGIGITNSVAYALGQFGITEPDPRKLDRFVGPPLIDSFMKYYGFSLAQAREAVDQYRVYYKDRGIFENRVYDGVEAMLQGLGQRQIPCILATSKPEEFAVQILEYFHLDSYFRAVCGATMAEGRTNKADVIAYALEKTGLQPGQDLLMVGDREHDILGGRANGLKTAGVLWGYGSRQELQEAGADFLLETPETLLDILKKS